MERSHPSTDGHLIENRERVQDQLVERRLEWVIRTVAARPVAKVSPWRAKMSTTSTPAVALMVTTSAAPSAEPPPMAPARSTFTSSRRCRRLHVVVSVPPSAFTSIRSTPFRSIAMFPRLRGTRDSRPDRGDDERLVSGRAVEDESVRALLTFDDIAPVAGSQVKLSSSEPRDATSAPGFR